jgi:hypothetical protein
VKDTEINIVKHKTKLLSIVLVLLNVHQIDPVRASVLRHRLLILADMGNEPDEKQQIVHMIMCSNEFEIEGLIAVTGKLLRPESRNLDKQVLHPELFTGIIDGYARVLDNLKKHASCWNNPSYLRKRRWGKPHPTVCE